MHIHFHSRCTYQARCACCMRFCEDGPWKWGISGCLSASRKPVRRNAGRRSYLHTYLPVYIVPPYILLCIPRRTCAIHTRYIYTNLTSMHKPRVHMVCIRYIYTIGKETYIRHLCTYRPRIRTRVIDCLKCDLPRICSTVFVFASCTRDRYVDQSLVWASQVHARECVSTAR